MSPLSHLEEYVSFSRSYLVQAAASIENGLAAAAGETLWKSITQSIKAVAARRGLNLRSESAIWDYAGVLAAGAGNTSAFPLAFHHAYLLNNDAYEGQLTPAYWLLLYENVAAGVTELLDMASQGAGR